MIIDHAAISELVVRLINNSFDKELVQGQKVHTTRLKQCIELTLSSPLQK
jgi:hypothetical protein